MQVLNILNPQTIGDITPKNEGCGVPTGGSISNIAVQFSPRNLGKWSNLTTANIIYVFFQMGLGWTEKLIFIIGT